MTLSPFLSLSSLLCGLAIFLYGMQQGEKNLRRIGGSDLRNVIAVITRHRLSAYIAGLVTTLATQSSSATTVMLVGLASAHLMTVGQSLGMILGSDLGTTVTVQLFAFKFHQLSPILIAAGFFGSLSSSRRVSGYGKLILAFGFIFFGMSIMSDAVAPLKRVPFFERSIHASLSNQWYGLLAGTLITAVIQSSAATLAIVIAIAQSFSGGNGWTPVAADFFPLVLGANLGTCVTAFLSTFRAELEGVRVAWAHFLFKLVGTVVVFPLIGLLRPLSGLIDGSPSIQIALLHTVFNLFISVLFLPLLKPFETLVIRTIRPGRKREQRFHVSYIGDNVISFPVLALSQAVKEIARMSERVARMVDQSKDLIAHYSSTLSEGIAQQDDEVDFLHEQLVTYLTRMAREELEHEQAARAYELIMVTTDLEHIGDIISKSVVRLSEKIELSPMPLSAEGKQEILEFYTITDQILKEALAAFTMSDLELARSVFDRKDAIAAKYEQYFDRHLNRLYKRKPESLQTTSIHIDLLEEIHRINDFTFRIAAHVLKIHRAE